ncbi:sortase family protein [Ruminiclostridium papyrosolvens DSM 2782]|uniref:Sortase family protein n=1 Tax=Ruminiclostridium papyrosolvens DSM 2782 TaxID=588581 RepID=F1T818_9FIRM|nr:class D sortase [Ruminiclostridium papyrosolvens]EGD49616.1 sortase family protein [Ruminiclostridium papyrosolvens DSM 2782]WES33251.1 class D sortase [Ruminiclostridium papyrosolvens DSM 2782]
MFKKLIPWILIVLGCLIIGFAIYLKADTYWNQHKLINQYEKYCENIKNQKGGPSDNNPEVSLDSNKPTEKKLPDTIMNPDQENEKKEEERKLPKIIGIMSIPKLDLKVAIGDGSSNAAMRYTVGHFLETAYPGENGNFAVIGHRSYKYGQFFNRLDELEKGDSIGIKSGTKTYEYIVTEKIVVKPEDTWVLNTTAKPTITLITCSPIRIATHRLVVKGVLNKIN